MKKKNETTDLPEFLTKQEVAKYFRVSTKTVERMMSTGLKSFKLRGKRYVERTNLKDYIYKHSTAS